MKLKEIVSSSELDLESSGIPDPRHDIEYLLNELLHIGKAELLIDPGMELSDEQILLIREALSRRKNHEPLQYICGRAYFRHIVLEVGKGVLIPRFDTEAMVDLALARLPVNGRLCDIGTGSGAIAISVASERSDCTVVATDISDEALAYARKNMRKAGIANMSLFKSDFFSGIDDEPEFDVITANLPYISSGEYENLPCEIRKYEPRPALLSGEDGLDAIRGLISDAWSFMRSGASLILEIPPHRKEELSAACSSCGKYSALEFHPDISGVERFCIIRLA